ncbi:hypothetical protein MOX02_59240 [Methylobacterium oxalidis]|uniref:Uncharacterized protein n=1 Tax=Methylobacterium oxalidis TaxID=944322 RepID=A0A512JD69_9HYPH|nr:hypothetical protein MOX02_59240 [Methylobacterium oxalidis]GLS67986.1 hypothetical protein GCM10007888_63710 [Methylobacterium oxalidis]
MSVQVCSELCCGLSGPARLRRYSDIVKRECGRVGSESWSGMVMFGKHKVMGSERDLSPVFL